MQAMQKRYDESYENEQVRVEIDWNGEVAEYRVFHRGYPEAQYVGASVQQAEKASGLTADEWTGLLASDNHAEIERIKIVRVVYWVGTNQRTSEVATYAEAMEVASGNSNAHDPAFYEISTGKRLFDDGNGLCYEDQSVYVC